MGPIPIWNEVTINFVFHPNLKEPVHLYFNSQGVDCSIYTNIIKNPSSSD